MKNLFLILIIPFLGFSQQIKVVEDFGIWTGISLEKDILNNANLILEKQIRTFKNSTKIDDYLIELTLQNSINKKINFSGKIRYTYDLKRFNLSEHNFRYSLGLTYKKPIIQNLSIRYRLQHQKEFINFYNYFLNESNEQNVFVNSVRNKLKLIYQYNPMHRFYSSIEFFRLHEVFRRPYFSKFRVLVGDQFTTQIRELDIAIVIEKELNTNYPYSFVFLKTIYKIKK